MNETQISKSREQKLKPQYNPSISGLENFKIAYEKGLTEEKARCYREELKFLKEYNEYYNYKNGYYHQAFSDRIRLLEARTKC